MTVPHDVLAAGWIPFVVVTILMLIFSFVYIRCFRHKTDWNMCAMAIAFLGLAVALATCALVPVDIFLVSFMKNSSGHFKPWAKQSGVRESIESSLLCAYYAMYGCMVLFLFFLLPFAFFYCEVNGNGAGVAKRCCNALIFSVVFVLLGLVLFVIGAFVPFPEKPANGTAQWVAIETIFGNFKSSHVESAISFMMSVLTVIAMFPLIVYLGCGMAVWPLSLLKGRRRIQDEKEETEEALIVNRAEVERLRARRTRSRRDERRVEELEERERLIQHHEHRLVEAERSFCRHSWCLLRPFEILFGILFLLLAFLVFTSLLITDIDKIMHSLGPLSGYILPSPQLPNPIDKILVYAQQVFPLDYILIIGLILFLFLCAMSAIRILGIRCCCFWVFRIRANRTRPRGLLLLCYLLMLIVLALNVLVYEMAPQYGMFGSQKYIKNVTLPDGNTTTDAVPCSVEAPNGECVMTRMSVLLVRFIYKLWFFGVAYYWASWAFLGMFLVALIFSAFHKRRSSIARELDAGDDEMLTA